MNLIASCSAALLAASPSFSLSPLAGALSFAAFWGAIVLIVAIPTYIHHRHKTRVAELNAAIKQQMIERGYPVEEILAVVNENPKLLAAGSKASGKLSPSKLPLTN